MQIPTPLIKTFNNSLTELGSELVLIALKEDGFGPFLPQASRGFSPREIQAIVRALSYPEVKLDGAGESGRTGAAKIRMRMTSPSHRTLLGVPLRFQRNICGALVIGRKDITSFSEKEQRHVENTAGELEVALAKSGVLGKVPSSIVSSVSTPIAATLPGAISSEMPLDASAIEAMLTEIQMVIPYDRALLTRYENNAQLLVGFLSHTPGHPLLPV